MRPNIPATLATFVLLFGIPRLAAGQTSPVPSDQAPAAQTPTAKADSPALPATQSTQDTVNPANEATPGRKLGFGIQAAPFPLFGPSVVWNPMPWLGLEMIGEALIDVDWLGGRTLLRGVQFPLFNVYAAGLLGVFHDGNVSEFLGPKQSDTALGYGGGIGTEIFFGRKSSFSVNVEVDFIHIDFEKRWSKYNDKAPSLIMLGVGVHYYPL
jgi:hypothetical protein